MASRVVINQAGIDELVKSDDIRVELTRRMERVLSAAQASAPVVTGEYRDGLHIAEVDGAVVVAGSSSHDFEVEADTGNLARALDAAGGS